MQGMSYPKLGLLFLAWCVCWVLLQAVALRYTFEFSWAVSFGDATLTNTLIALAGYEMILVTQYYQPRRLVRLVMSLGTAALCILAIRYLGLWLMDDVDGYVFFLDRSLFIRGLYIWLMLTLVSAFTAVWSSLREEQEVRARKDDMEKLARDAELMRLRQQLHPHFLFNSLNSISALAGSRPDEARSMIQQLSDFLRGTLKKDDQQLVTLSEELEHLQLYLEIEKVRFGHRLHTSVEYDEQALSMRLPSLLLQPVVENAIKFGLYDTTGETRINIAASSLNGVLVVQIANPFDPETAKPKKGTGFGLSSVQRRLYLLYARNDLLETTQDGQTFITKVRIPQTA